MDVAQNSFMTSIWSGMCENSHKDVKFSYLRKTFLLDLNEFLIFKKLSGEIYLKMF
mgnify:CR=1 FL=1